MLSFLRNLFRKKINNYPENKYFDKKLVVREEMKFSNSISGEDPKSEIALITTVTNKSSKIETTPEISLSSVRKEATKVKREHGTTEAINYLNNYIKNNKLDINNISYLLEKLVPYMLKENTFSENDIVEYIKKQYNNYSEKEKKEAIAYYNDISKLLNLVSIEHSIAFLKESIGDFMLNKDDSSLFDAIIILSELYLEKEKPDEAFQLARRALLMVTNFNDKEAYLSKQTIITDLQARICYEGYSPPKYRDYCYYSLINYFLEICNSLNNFPHSLVFFEDLKNDFKNFNWTLANEIDNILENTTGIKNKNKFLNDIYEVAFTVVPELIGLPKKYLNQNIIEQTKNNESERNMLYKLINDFEERPFKEIAKLHELTSKLISKYLKSEHKNKSHLI